MARDMGQGGDAPGTSRTEAERERWGRWAAGAGTNALPPTTSRPPSRTPSRPTPPPAAPGVPKIPSAKGTSKRVGSQGTSRRPRTAWLPPVPDASPSLSAGYGPDLEAPPNQEAVEGMSVEGFAPVPPPSAHERLEEDLYGLIDIGTAVIEVLGGEAASFEAGAKSKMQEMLEHPADSAVEFLWGAAWRWGAEVFYQLPKVPERLFWLVHERIEALEAGEAGDPLGDLMLIAASPTGKVEEGSLLEGEIDAIFGVLQEGEIGYSLAKHPERVEPFREDLDAGMPVDEAVKKYEDFWLEMGLNTLIDPAWLIPAELFRVIWPGGVVMSKAVEKGLQGVGAVVGKIPITRWLTKFTKRSQVTMRGNAAADAISELVLKAPATEDVVEVVNKALLGELEAPLLSERAVQAIEALIELEVRNVDELLARYLPDVTPAAARKLLQKHPEYIPHLISSAVETKVAQELGYIAPGNRGIIARAYDFAKGILKEQWLSANPAYVLANASDNTAKCWLSGHFVNPLERNVTEKVSAFLAESGIAIPSNVAQSLVEVEMGASRMRQVPIPGLGKPREVLEFWNTLLGRNVDAPLTPWLSDIIPARPTDAAVQLGLAEPVGRVAKILDVMNYASISEAGRKLSSNIESSARAQMFWKVFSKELEDTARPALMAGARGMPEEILAGLRHVKSPADITKLAEAIVEGADAPVARLSSLLPEGATGDAYEHVAKVLDQLQDDAIKTGTLDNLMEHVDDLFGTVAERARQMQEAAGAEEVITQWRAAQVHEKVEGLMLRTRELTDNLLIQVQERLGMDPKQAGSLWPRYFDTKSRLVTESQAEVSRLVREKSPNISAAVDDLLGNIESVTPDRLANGLSYDEWGLFGEKLAALREFVDEGQEVAWKTFLDGDHTEERLEVVEEAYEQIHKIWEKASDEASVLRDGYLHQVKSGNPRITPEEYAERMTTIWEQHGFMPVQETWTQTADLLGYAATEELGEVTQSVLRQQPLAEMEAMEHFRQLQRSDPDAALKWFQKQSKEFHLVLQKDAQREYVEEMGYNYSSKMQGDAESLTQNIADWRTAIQGRIDEILQTRSVATGEKAALKAQLEPLAKAWAEAVDTASVAGQEEVNRLLYDYSKTQVWEGGLSAIFPFTKWQLRNPFTWAKIMQQQPGAFSLMTRYIRASDADRERRNLSARFQGMMPLPGQEKLQELGVLGRGHWGINPNPFMSVMGQIKADPWITPAESEMGAETPGTIAWALKQPEKVGIHMWPWLQQAAAAMGVAEPSSFGIAGAPGRISPEVREGEEALQGLLPGGAPDTTWLKEYWTQQALAALVAEGVITPEQAAAPTPELLANTQAYVDGMQTRLGQARWLQPMTIKHARPGELAIRDLKSEIREMPESRAAYLRSQHPELAAYGRAVAGVNEPDKADWMAERDTINLKYDKMLEGIPPWHPRSKEIETARWEEIDSLGEQPGEPYSGPQDMVQELVENRPRPEDYESAGAIDWEKFNEQEEAYLAELPDDVSEDEYMQYRRRYMSPLELIWAMKQEKSGQGWDEYNRLREEGETEELQAWKEEGIQQRIDAGWEYPDILSWAEQQTKLPYEEVQRLLQDDFGPEQVQDYMDQLLEERPWLSETDYPEERGDLDAWMEEEMPGMFDAVGAKEQQQQVMRDWYYDMLPNQRREAARNIGLDRDADLDTWLERTGIDQFGEQAAQQVYALFKPLTAEERLEVERDMIRWEHGRGEWTEKLEMYYTDQSTAKARFWSEMNQVILNEEAYDDPMLAAVLSKDVRGMLEYTDEQMLEFRDYLREHRDELTDSRAMQLAEEYPVEFGVAQEEAVEVRGLVGPDALQALYMSLDLIGERQQWQEDNPDEWAELTAHWDERSRVQVENPHYLFFYKNDQYQKWHGDVDPGEVDVNAALAAYDVANADMDAFEAGEGEWTTAMDHWFGGGSKSDFWTYYHANKENFDWKGMRDDNLLEAALSQGAKPFLTSEGEELMYEEALRHLKMFWREVAPIVVKLDPEPEPEPEPVAESKPKKSSGGGGGSSRPPPPPPKPPGM